MADSAKPPEAGGSISETMFPDVKTTLNLFGIHKRQVRGNWQYPLHHHPQYEINYLLDGRQVMSVGGIEYAQGPGDLLLIRPGELHNSRSGDGRPFTYFCLHFDLDDRLFLPMLGRLEQVLFKEDSALARKVSPILRKMLEPELDPDSRSVSARMRLQSAVFELFALLWDAVSQEVSQLPPRTYGKEELAHEIAGRLQSISVLRFEPGQGRDEGQGIREIASELGISVSHCGRVFREVYGQSPRAYWSSLVLHESRHLLSDSKYSIQMVAGMLGYRDIAHFSRQFKRWTGFSPSEYRKQLHV
ncbi:MULTISPECIES: AraC family transcriptional regulator [unclassified Paenibacillus]|uniref:helix-turn-helix domain-containing protein n=1 Tax=unclassified Paenibacillus TaxID=185978 RepID=UPI0009542187|nr:MULTISPECIES: AraC family transcriptional regulator [unclassified Paenibacillus]ASS64949.1 AraC family transcriptional regulator [Paenibacillus sp. RUD330]SIR00356.1 AraC-type DNA-binding protein [Paenibacillus sp. RU4X]SIR34562.1 AraC-type DNA-binding protein [Paenibacillus sp. RU4T]